MAEEPEQLAIDEDDDAYLLPSGRGKNLVALPARDEDYQIMHPEIWREMVRRFNEYPALQARLAEVEEERDAVAAVRDMMGNLWADAKDRAEAAEAALATARADALREAAHKLGEVAKKHSAGRAEIIKAVGRAILALIDNPKPTK